MGNTNPQSLGTSNCRITGATFHGKDVKMVSQDPSECLSKCPECGADLESHYIGANDDYVFYIKSCPYHPLKAWNNSRSC